LLWSQHASEWGHQVLNWLPTKQETIILYQGFSNLGPTAILGWKLFVGGLSWALQAVWQHL